MTPVWLPGSFPVTAAEAPLARQTSGTPASADLRRAATVVGWTVMDGMQNIAATIGLTTPGPRGGLLTYDGEQDPPFRFDRVRFTRDLSVTGALAWDGPDLDGEFTVVLPNGSTTAAAVQGPYRIYGAGLTVTLQGRTFSIPSF